MALVEPLAAGALQPGAAGALGVLGAWRPALGALQLALGALRPAALEALRLEALEAPLQAPGQRLLARPKAGAWGAEGHSRELASPARRLPAKYRRLATSSHCRR